MQNPFYEEPLHKAFYIPSSEQAMTEQVKAKSALHAERLDHENQEEHTSDELQSPDLRFLKGGFQYTKQGLKSTKSPVDGQMDNKFNESWPDSERPSTLSVAEVEAHTLSPISSDDPLVRLQQHKNWLSGFTRGADVTVSLENMSVQDEEQPKEGDREATLKKYIEQFRHGTPMSREDRQKKGLVKKEDFWWLQKQSKTSPLEPSESSTPKDAAGKTKSRIKPQAGKKTARDGEKASHPVGSSHLPHAVLSTSLDEQTRHLQARADQVLEKSSASSAASVVSTEPAVSTDGLGSTSGNSTRFSAVSEEKPYRPSFIRNANKENYGPLTEYQHQGEDILQQWRLRRKMEQAQHTDRPQTQTDTAAGPAVLTSNADVDREVEAKLNAFRKRLALREPGQVHFTPAPVSPAPAPYVPQQQPQPQPQQHAPVASPHLQRAPDDVTPHLHLSCDILPCPQHPPSSKMPLSSHPTTTTTTQSARATTTSYQGDTHRPSEATSTYSSTASGNGNQAVPPHSTAHIGSGDAPLPHSSSSPFKDQSTPHGQQSDHEHMHTHMGEPVHRGEDQGGNEDRLDRHRGRETERRELDQNSRVSTSFGASRCHEVSASQKSTQGPSASQKSNSVPTAIPPKSSASPVRLRASPGGHRKLIESLESSQKLTESLESSRLSFDPDISDRLLPHVAPYCQDSDSSFEKLKMSHVKSLQREKLSASGVTQSSKTITTSQAVLETPPKVTQSAPPAPHRSEQIANEHTPKVRAKGKGKAKTTKGKKEPREQKRMAEMHSSPKYGIKDTIGQVVGEHLFLPSDSVISSIEWPESPSGQQQAKRGLMKATETPKAHSTLLEEQSLLHTPPTRDDCGTLVGSDVEENTEDDFLRDLQRKEQYFLQMLQAIDHVKAVSK